MLVELLYKEPMGPRIITLGGISVLDTTPVDIIEQRLFMKGYGRVRSRGTDAETRAAIFAFADWLTEDAALYGRIARGEQVTCYIFIVNNVPICRFFSRCFRNFEMYMLFQFEYAGVSTRMGV